MTNKRTPATGMDDQDAALRNRVATMQAVTLADAAAQLYVAMGVAEFIEDFKLSEVTIGQEVIKLRRMLRCAADIRVIDIHICRLSIPTNRLKLFRSEA